MSILKYIFIASGQLNLPGKHRSMFASKVLAAQFHLLRHHILSIIVWTFHFSIFIAQI